MTKQGQANSGIQVKESLQIRSAEISESFLLKLQSYYDGKLVNPSDPIHYNNMQRVVFYQTIEHNMYGLFLYDLDQNTFLVNEGYFHQDALQLINNYKHFLFEKKTDQILQVFLENDMYTLRLHLIETGGRFYTYGAIYTEESLSSEVFNNTRQMLFRFFFQNTEFLKDLCIYDSIPKINESIRLIKNESIAHGHRMHLILIQIEPLKKYIKVAGDYLVNELIRGVKNEIDSIIGDKGGTHVINPRQFLIIATDIDEIFIKEKFSTSYFRIKNLLLVYQLKFYEVENLSEDCNMTVAWKNLQLK